MSPVILNEFRYCDFDLFPASGCTNCLYSRIINYTVLLFQIRRAEWRAKHDDIPTKNSYDLFVLWKVSLEIIFIYVFIYLLMYFLFDPLLSVRFCSETASFMQTSKRKRTSTSLSSIIHASALTLHCNRKSVIFPLLKQGLTSSLMSNPNLVRMPVSRWRITVKHVSHTCSLNEMSLPQSCLFALFSPRVTATVTLILNHCR